MVVLKTGHQCSTVARLQAHQIRQALQFWLFKSPTSRRLLNDKVKRRAQVVQYLYAGCLSFSQKCIYIHILYFHISIYIWSIEALHFIESQVFIVIL